MQLFELDADRRTLVTSDEPATVEAMLDGEWHGRPIEVSPDASFRV